MEVVHSRTEFKALSYCTPEIEAIFSGEYFCGVLGGPNSNILLSISMWNVNKEFL